MHVLSILAAEESSNSGSVLGLFLPMLIIGGAMYMLMIRPQRRKMRAQAALQSSIEVGDEVMTTSGIYGFITGFDGDVAWLEIDDNIQIRIARQGIQRKVDTAVGDTAVPSDTQETGGKKSRHTKIGDVIVNDDAEAPRDNAG